MTGAPRRALIGWSGFVGGALLPRVRPVARFRSADIDQLPESSVDEIVCALHAPGMRMTVVVR